MKTRNLIIGLVLGMVGASGCEHRPTVVVNASAADGAGSWPDALTSGSWPDLTLKGDHPQKIWLPEAGPAFTCGASQTCEPFSQLCKIAPCPAGYQIPASGVCPPGCEPSDYIYSTLPVKICATHACVHWPAGCSDCSCAVFPLYECTSRCLDQPGNMSYIYDGLCGTPFP